MRPLFSLSLLLSALTFAQPQISHPVTDLAKVLSPAKVESLSRQLEDHRKTSGVQLAVLTVDTTGGEPIEAFSLRAATAWGGGARRRDDGGLFVLAVKDRRMRIELGYGLEGRVTDVQAQQILEGAKPFLRDGDPDGAVQSVVDRLTQLTMEGTMSAEERARLDAEAEAARPAIPPELHEIFAYVLTLIVFGLIGRVARSRLEGDAPPSKVQVGVILALLIGAAELGWGVAGFTWLAGWAALCGTIAGLSFLFANGILTLQYPIFMLVSTLILAMFIDDSRLSFAARGLAHLLLSLFFGAFDSAWSQASKGTSFDSMGVRSSSSGGSSRRRDDDDDDWAPSRSSSRSSSSSSWASSSSSRSSSRSSGSSGGGYKGGGGSFGGGGASSSW